MSKANLYNATNLAKEVSRSPAFVFAMKKCGYEFTHGRLTTRRSAMDWLAANPDFSYSMAYPKKPKLPGLPRTNTAAVQTI